MLFQKNKIKKKNNKNGDISLINLTISFSLYENPCFYLHKLRILMKEISNRYTF